MASPAQRPKPGFPRRVAAAVRQDPAGAVRLAVAAARGTWYALIYRLVRRDVRIALPFFAFHRVTISGPGRVRIGPFCQAHPSAFRGVSIVTLARDATVTLGRGCQLGGTAIRCAREVTLGDGCMAARCVVQDVLFCRPEHLRAGNATALAAQCVSIGRNVWIGAFSRILAGSAIGNDSVLSWGATCLMRNVPDYHYIAGSPAGRSIPIDLWLGLIGSC